MTQFCIDDQQEVDKVESAIPLMEISELIFRYGCSLKFHKRKSDKTANANLHVENNVCMSSHTSNALDPESTH